MIELYLQHVYVLCCGTDENFAADFESSFCQTFLRQAAKEQSLILVHISLTSSEIRNCRDSCTQ